MAKPKPPKVILNSSPLQIVSGLDKKAIKRLPARNNQDNVKVEAARQRFYQCIESCLDVVASQVEKYKVEYEDQILPVRDIKDLTSIAGKLFEIAQVQSMEEKRKAIKNKSATLRSVKDIAEMLKIADPDIDYAEVLDPEPD